MTNLSTRTSWSRATSGRAVGLGLAACALTLGAACDNIQDRVFPGAIEGVPSVLDLGTLEVVPVNSREELAEEVVYGEVGPTGSSEEGGISFNFQGINGPVCLWVDPETVFWNQSVSPTNPSAIYRVPDNPYDDGDLDMEVGQSLYYTGTPGERMGRFQVRYEDSNGQVIPIELSECDGPDAIFQGAASIGKAGRGTPEFCTVRNTLQGVSYTVALTTWSTPVDDDRLGFGLLVMEGDCQGLINAGFGSSGGPGLPGQSNALPKHEYECIIKGEAVKPNEPGGTRAAAEGLPERSWKGQSEVPSWERSVEFEEAFCRRITNDDGPGLVDYCRRERRRIQDSGSKCSWSFDASVPGNGEKCFCGDRNDTPSPGAF